MIHEAPFNRFPIQIFAYIIKCTAMPGFVSTFNK